MHSMFSRFLTWPCCLAALPVPISRCQHLSPKIGSVLSSFHTPKQEGETVVFYECWPLFRALIDKCREYYKLQWWDCLQYLDNKNGNFIPFECEII